MPTPCIEWVSANSEVIAKLSIPKRAVRTENTLIKTAVKDIKDFVDLEKHAPDVKSVNFSIRDKGEKILNLVTRCIKGG